MCMIDKITMNASNHDENNSVSSIEEREDTLVSTLLIDQPTPQVMPASVAINQVNEAEANIPETPEPTTTNGLLSELQNLLSVACYECVNQKTMKNDELMLKMHEQLFSNSTRIGFAKQLIRGEGHFSNLFDRVSIESRGMNNSNGMRYRLRIKSMLVGGDKSKSWFISDVLTANKLCMSSIHS